jgi:acyl carrier protein
MWEQATGLTAHLGAAGRGRARGAVLPLDTAHGLDLLDAALAADADAPLAVAVAAHIDLARLRAQAQAGPLPPLWRALVRAPAAQATALRDSTLRQQLAGLAEAGQHELILGLVRTQAAAVLGHPTADPVRPGAAFRDLGFDSLTAIELRNRLAAATGLRLPATLAFDQPTPQALAGWLRAAIGQDGTAPAPAAPVLTELDKLRSVLSKVNPGDSDRAKITARLEALLSEWKGANSQANGDAAELELDSATDNEMFDYIDKQLGLP